MVVKDWDWAIGKIADHMVDLAKRKVPIDRADLMNSIKAEVVKGDKVDTIHIYATEPQAVFVEYGTGLYVSPDNPFGSSPHIIKANHLTAKGMPGYMRFKVPRHSVHHNESIPGNHAFVKDGYVYTQMSRGMHPHPFLRPAIFESKSYAIERFKEIGAL